MVLLNTRLNAILLTIYLLLHYKNTNIQRKKKIFSLYLVDQNFENLALYKI